MDLPFTSKQFLARVRALQPGYLAGEVVAYVLGLTSLLLALRPRSVRLTS